MDANFQTRFEEELQHTVAHYIDEREPRNNSKQKTTSSFAARVNMDSPQRDNKGRPGVKVSGLKR